MDYSGMTNHPLMTREINNYLVILRDSGRINMFGAAPYLQSRFGLGRQEAKDVLLAWMKGDRHEIIEEEDEGEEITGDIPTTYSGEHPFER